MAGADRVALQADGWLFRAGEAADSAFVIQSGRLEVIVEDEVIRTVKRGGVIGELALLTGEPRSASVRAVRDTALLRIDRRAFERAISEDHEFTVALCGALATRLAASTGPARLPDPVGVVAVITLDQSISVDDVAGRLAGELEAAGRATVLRDQPDHDAAEHATRVDRAAERNRWVIVAATAGPADPWTRTCLSEADRVVAVTRGSPDADWRRGTSVLRGSELLILGRDGAPRMVDAFRPRSVQLLADEQAVRRCLEVGARRLAGRALGVVLSGGGARAFAHLGVIEELRAAGARIDRVAGASMGALIAGAVAQDLDDAAIYDAIHVNFVEQNPSGDYTLPLYSLVRGRRTERLLAEAFGDTRIEQLPRRFFCVSTDLNARSLVVHRSGPLHEAVFASLSIPACFRRSGAPTGGCWSMAACSTTFRSKRWHATPRVR